MTCYLGARLRHTGLASKVNFLRHLTTLIIKKIRTLFHRVNSDLSTISSLIEMSNNIV